MPNAQQSCFIGLAVVMFVGAAGLGSARAYTAAGDRVFPATILLPQIAPSDELYLTGNTQPVSGGRESSFTLNYDKTITDRLGLGISQGYNWIDQTGTETQRGWQNTAIVVQYIPIIDAADEFLLSVGGERELGGTGTARAGADAAGATTPMLYLGKGFGDIGVDALRPIAVAGVFGYSLGDTAARPDAWVAGMAVEYSFPYFASKVATANLPDWLRTTTPMVEILLNTPARQRGDAKTTVKLAPGVECAGSGWELGAEMLLPLTRASGQGVGFSLQLHLALDYLLPDSIGQPIFGD